MAYREVPRMEIKELLRRWQAGDSLRHIAAGTGPSRDTASKYVAAAREDGIARDGPMPTKEQLVRLVMLGQPGPHCPKAPRQDDLEPRADQIYRWITNDRLQMTRIHELLVARGCELSYQSLWRFMLKRNWRRPSNTTVRMADTPPA